MVPGLPDSVLIGLKDFEKPVFIDIAQEVGEPGALVLPTSAW